jgi:hypothetical protein
MRNAGWDARTRLLWAKDKGETQGKKLVIGNKVQDHNPRAACWRAKMKAYIYINPNAPAEVP